MIARCPRRGDRKVNVIPSMETGYLALRPAFLQALGKLSRQGFAVFPVDTLDIIHDFFAEAWDGVTKHYDSRKGPFENYAYVSFVHFARPRIIQMKRLQSGLVDHGELMTIIDEKLSINPDSAFLPDLGIIEECISRLPQAERDVLSAYFCSEVVSERTLAKRFDLSRYKLKEILLSGIAKIMISLDRPASLSEQDWNVALALWRDSRTFNEAARCLGMSVQQVKESSARSLRFVSHVLKNYQSWGHNRTGRYAMSATPKPNHMEVLFTKALRSQGDRSLLREIERNADQILVAMELSVEFGPTEEELKCIDPSWLAEIYYALSGVREDIVPGETAFWATADREESIGLAFKNALIPGLSERLKHFETGLRAVPRVASDEIEYLLSTPAASAARPVSEYLAERGLTPLSIFHAIDGVSYLLERLAEQDLIGRGGDIVLDEEMVRVDEKESDVLNLGLVIDEIGQVAACEEETAREVYKWLIQVAQYKPFLFPGFRSQPSRGGKGVHLTGTHLSFEDLFQRWGLGDENGLHERVASADGQTSG